MDKKSQPFRQQQIDTISMREYLTLIDIDNLLWRDNAAYYSVACKKAMSFNLAQ